jgi:uncharacterized repeat protein (TIGR01451 family)
VFITSDVVGSVTVSAVTEDDFAASGTTFDTKSADPVNKDYMDPGVELAKTVYAGHDGGASAPGGELVNGALDDPVTYVFTVTNIGDAHLDSITIDDADLGITTADLTLLSGSTPLAPAESLVHYYETTITGDLINTATVTGNPTEADGTDLPGFGNPTDSDTAEVSVIFMADLELSKTVDNPEPDEEEEITFTITLTNRGPADATGFEVTDLMPDGLSYDSDDGFGAYNDVTGVWTVGDLDAGASVTLTITAEVDAGTAGTTITNTAEVTAADQDDPDSTPNNGDPDEDDQDSATITVQGPIGGGGVLERVIINEIAWAGTAADPQHEWIELRNLETTPIDLTGWTLRWRRKQPSTPEERKWKVVELTGILGPADESVLGISEEDKILSVKFVKREGEVGSWMVTAELEERDESYYTLERQVDETVSNVEADLIYDDTPPYTMELYDLGAVLELLNPLGEVVDTANAFDPEGDGWPAGNVATFATMERTDPLGPDVEENWHTNLGIITRGLDADGRPLVATADVLNSRLLDELVVSSDIEPASISSGAQLEAELELPHEAMREFGWPWIRVTRPDIAGAVGGGGVVEEGYSFSGDYEEAAYRLNIDTAGLSPGQYNFWIVYGEGEAVVIPIEVLP